MVRVRKLVLAIAAASALSSGMAHALGVGEVKLKSVLNQPLDAEIALLEVGDLASSEVISKLASPEEFNKAGVDRQYFLTDLKFTPVLKPNGQSVIRVTSSKPVREPYLNFLVEVVWPSGRLLREYTLLLDPPLYAPQSAAAAVPSLPVAAPAPAPVSRAPATAPSSRPAPAARPATSGTGIQGKEYRTHTNDTLWRIAERVGSGGSIHQTMLAIQELNPDAFIDGNINRLKSGQVLRLPDAQQVQKRTRGEALAQFNEQNAAWRGERAQARSGGNGVRQLDATRRSEAGAAPAEVENKDTLKLVAGEPGKSAAGDSAGDRALSEKLAITEESLDTTRRENAELKSRMDDLQSQLDKLQRLIQLKDAQLAKLQADLGSPQAGEPAVAEAAAPSSETPQPEAAEGSEPVAEAVAEAPVAPLESAGQPAEAAPPAAASEEAPAAAPAPAVVDEPAEPAEPSLLDELMDNQMLLWAAGGSALLVLLILLMILSRRRAQQEAQQRTSLQDEGEDAAQESDFSVAMDLPESDFSDLEPQASLASAAPVAQAAAPQAGSDVLGEADIYIAYGRFTQAAELLSNAINDEPQRTDLRLKLMEVQAELGDRGGFAHQENELREIGGVNAEIDQLKARYPGMVAVAAAAAAASLAGAGKADDFDFSDLSFDETPATPLEDEFDLNLDVVSETPATPAADEALFDFDLDSVADEPAPALEADDLSASLDDFSLDLEVPSGTPAPESEDEFLLDLESELESAEQPVVDSFELPDLVLDEPGEPAVEVAAAELPADFDLSFDDEPQAPQALDEDLAVAAPAALEEPVPSFDLDEPALAEDDFDFLSGTDETATKLDLARAYIDMGDAEGARDILEEVLGEGNQAQQQEARELIATLA